MFAVPANATNPIQYLGLNASDCQGLINEQYDVGRDVYSDMSSGVDYATFYEHIDQSLNTNLLNCQVALGAEWHGIVLEMWGHDLASVANGDVDTQLNNIRSAASIWLDSHPGHTLVIAPLHEANGTWYPWSIGKNGATNATFKSAWSRVRSIIKTDPRIKLNLVVNVQYGGQSGALPDFFPGRSAVDYYTVDGYNRSQSQGGWQTPASVFNATLTTMFNVGGTGIKYGINETGTSEPGQNAGSNTKAGWYQSLGTWLSSDPNAARLEYISMFDIKTDTDDWRIWPYDTFPQSSGTSRYSFITNVKSVTK